MDSEYKPFPSLEERINEYHKFHPSQTAKNIERSSAVLVALLGAFLFVAYGYSGWRVMSPEEVKNFRVAYDHATPKQKLDWAFGKPLPLPASLQASDPKPNCICANGCGGICHSDGSCVPFCNLNRPILEDKIKFSGRD